MRDAGRGEDDPLESDIEFHVAVLHASGNPSFAQFKDVSIHGIAHVDPVSRTRLPVIRRILPAHEAVFDAIAARRCAGARRTMDELIALTRRLIVKPPTHAPGRAGPKLKRQRR
jgi:DNA-binding FadR family transcriptional regulator